MHTEQSGLLATNTHFSSDSSARNNFCCSNGLRVLCMAACTAGAGGVLIGCSVYISLHRNYDNDEINLNHHEDHTVSIALMAAGTLSLFGALTGAVAKKCYSRAVAGKEEKIKASSEAEKQSVESTFKL